MTDLAANIFSNVWSLALIILFFGGSIFVHELGHFLAARRRGLRVERFSIGFGPKIVAWKRDGVEYRISWIPLGGYVALPQLADMRGVEGEGAAELDSLPPISYTSKMIVSVMGAVFNLLFAVALSFVIWQFGLPTTDIQTTTQIGFVTETLELKDGSEVTSPASYAGLQEGDTITAIDGKEVDDWGSLLQTLVSGTGRDEYDQPKSVLTIDRNGESMEIEIYPRVSGDDNVRRIGITPAETLMVERTLENSPAALAGLKSGDVLTAIDGRHFYSRFQLQDYLETNRDRDIEFTIERDGELIVKFIRPAEIRITKEGDKAITIGAAFAYPRKTIHPTPPEQITKTFVIMYRILSGLVNPKSDLGIGHMSGPPGIARILWETAQVDIRIVIWFTIIINVNLAIFNLLPIPVLDGGHMLFATIGKLAGRPLPPNFMAAAQSTFMILLFSLLVFVSFNDIGRCFRDKRDGREYRDNTIEPVFEKSEETSPGE
ncbi:MAG: RIP metalloprotease RseP [Verrucomicrobia bacterium]|nr:MAG: RIP metalloprotease RseP [Verrucomicrobiota bacterium]